MDNLHRSMHFCSVQCPPALGTHAIASQAWLTLHRSLPNGAGGFFTGIGFWRSLRNHADGDASLSVSNGIDKQEPAMQRANQADLLRALEAIAFNPWHIPVATWRTIRERAELPKVRIHGLRHTFASWLKQRVVPETTIMTLMESQDPEHGAALLSGQS